ncbi:hypothetical protein IEO21_03718 [Rhodonia placenta]|uniref:Terpenoid synthase n=1 Tax=Rhodonia placenta TaxID=104341 RepID=A0A8H7P5K6_9APHY|nr:hypothetical protein IEO21_03718 [Postia placenta]
MASWPWPRIANPYCKEVKAESEEWLKSFQAFTPQSQIVFDRGDFSIPGLFSALLYSSCMKEHLRLGCDLTHIFFVIDEYTDIENEPGCREMIDMAIDALENPGKPRPEGEIPLGEIIRHLPLELDLSVPDEIFYHPVIVELSTCITDLTLVDNYHARVESKFIEGLKNLPSWGAEVDTQVTEYLTRIANWPRANYCWSFESHRYFGDKGLELSRTHPPVSAPHHREKGVWGS